MNEQESIVDSEFLAFVHIEKAAGTTFIHILRRAFFLRYVDVRPLNPDSGDCFRAADLSAYMKINPALRAFGGHSVRPFSDLLKKYPRIHFVTILRNPINRYLSQYHYGVRRLGLKANFNDFLAETRTHNFQVKKLADDGNIDTAKRVLRERFSVVGVVERLDEFLVLFKKKLDLDQSLLGYEIVNAGNKQHRTDPLLEQYGEQIVLANSLDMELYDYVTCELLPAQIAEYGDEYDSDIVDFTSQNHVYLCARAKYYSDWFIRKFYYEPVSNLIRKLKGMPAKGSYSWH